MKCDVLIIGAGPAGLRCAKKLADRGTRVIVLERQTTIGKKVCAGGITWNGLITRIPDSLIERTFRQQRISTRFQSVSLSSEHPIVATVNREKLGRYMADQAVLSGAQLLAGCRVSSIGQKNFQQIIRCSTGSSDLTITCDYLVGADGSQSRVRSFLGLPTNDTGLGMHYMVPQVLPEMKWHFDAQRFGCGYSWIFPHRESSSIGAFIGSRIMPGRKLKENMDEWLLASKIPIRNEQLRAARVNCDFRGYHFDRVFLIGDAAGFASPLTGEGINPAFVSAETVARIILDRGYVPGRITQLIKRHQAHRRMQRLACQSSLLSIILSELSAFMLKYRMMSFNRFEMA